MHIQIALTHQNDGFFLIGGIPDQSWGNLVTCNLSYVIFITFQVKSSITKLLFS